MMIKKPETQKKMDALLKALVKAYGEGAIITRQQLLETWNKNREKYPHIVAIRKNPDYRVGRGAYVVTTDENPKKAREAAQKLYDKQMADEAKEKKAAKTEAKKTAPAAKKKPAAKKTTGTVSKATKADPAKLAKAVAPKKAVAVKKPEAGEQKNAVAPSQEKNPQAAKIIEVVEEQTVEIQKTSSMDINDVLNQA